MHKKNLIIAGVFFLLFGSLSKKATAQNYSYTFADTTALYAVLDTSASSAQENIWTSGVCRIPIGFSFSFAGTSYDSVTIRNNGVLAFDIQNKYNAIFLNKDFIADVDEQNVSTPSLFYLLSTTDANQKILKIEFRNVSMMVPGDTRLHCSFQVWLKEYSNKVEFHMGTIENDSTVTNNFEMGLINMNGGEEDDLGYLISGDPAQPTAALMPHNSSLVSLSALPTPNTVYIFTPASN